VLENALYQCRLLDGGDYLQPPAARLSRAALDLDAGFGLGGTAPLCVA
jgi:hypothetical protein